MDTENTNQEPWVSAAQKEVWEWKEALSKQTKNMSMLETILYIREKSRSTVEKIKAAQKANAEKESWDHET